MDFDEARNTIKNNKNLTQYSIEELQYVQTPLGKACYKSGRPKKNEFEKAKPTDKITCEICGKNFFRSGRANHYKTEYHKAHNAMNSKLRKILIEK